MTLIDTCGCRVSYNIDDIASIKHGRADTLYCKSDLNGNCIKADDSLLVIQFKDGSISSFSSNWTIVF